MNHKLSVNNTRKQETHAYDILIEQDYKRLPMILEDLNMSNRRFMIITDRNVGALYSESITSLLRPLAKQVELVTIPAGESSKNLDTVELCYDKLITAGFDRMDILIALGGGVVGDLTGFVASTYLRGIRFIQLPTSLLSMVDSSIGGKTGVDFKAYKNMVGAFYQPKLVYINTSVLQSLPDTEFYSGISEIIKHGLIQDADYYQWLITNEKKIKSKDAPILMEMILRSCQIKKAVVEEDPKEEGIRALLNFGHTIGHSIEKLKNFTLLHGECVAIGMAAAAYLSHKRGLLHKEDYENILQTIQLFHQPITVSGLLSDEILAATKLDKKMDSGQIRFILLEKIGEAIIDRTVTEGELMDAIHSIERHGY
jgi:3-dehydroquinate synthase